jgi:hypothetical protein
MQQIKKDTKETFIDEEHVVAARDMIQIILDKREPKYKQGDKVTWRGKACSIEYTIPPDQHEPHLRLGFREFGYSLSVPKQKGSVIAETELAPLSSDRGI